MIKIKKFIHIFLHLLNIIIIVFLVSKLFQLKDSFEKQLYLANDLKLYIEHQNYSVYRDFKKLKKEIDSFDDVKLSHKAKQILKYVNEVDDYTNQLESELIAYTGGIRERDGRYVGFFNIADTEYFMLRKGDNSEGEKLRKYVNSRFKSLQKLVPESEIYIYPQDIDSSYEKYYAGQNWANAMFYNLSLPSTLSQITMIRSHFLSECKESLELIIDDYKKTNTENLK